jgi:hypothetical protein
MSDKHKHKPVTHEAFIQSVFALALRREALTKADHKALAHIKLTYGTGAESGLRGVTWFDKWDCGCGADGKRLEGRKPIVGHLICLVATGQEHVCQLIGTTLHELAHAMAGPGHGHGPEWKAACERIGIPGCTVHCSYDWGLFDPDLVPKLQALPIPNDGMPRSARQVVEGLRAKGGAGLPPGLVAGPLPEAPKLRPCGAGFGTRGGTSRGQGSGSRLLKYVCGCKPKPVIVRHAGAALKAQCLVCSKPFKLDDASVPPAHGMGASGQGVPAKTARQHGARKPLAKRRPKPKAKAGPKAKAKPSPVFKELKKTAKAVIARLNAKAKAEAEAPSAKAIARRFAAKAQAPLAPSPEPQFAGSVEGQDVHHKPSAPFCETHNGPASLCGCVA